MVADLREIAQTLSAAWDVDTTLDLVARKTAQVMHVDSCSIYLLDPSGETPAAARLDRPGPPIPGPGRAQAGRRTHGLGRPERTARGRPRRPAPIRALSCCRKHVESGLHSLLAVPLINRGRVIGAFNVQTREPTNFTPMQIELAALISDLAAGAIDRALLYDNMNRQIAELTTLAKVSRNSDVAHLSGRDARPRSSRWRPR